MEVGYGQGEKNIVVLLETRGNIIHFILEPRFLLIGLCIVLKS